MIQRACDVDDADGSANTWGDGIPIRYSSSDSEHALSFCLFLFATFVRFDHFASKCRAPINPAFYDWCQCVCTVSGGRSGVKSTYKLFSYLVRCTIQDDCTDLLAAF